MNTYLQDGAIFCNHSGVLNQLMIDKFTSADIAWTTISICCLIVGLLQYWIDYWIVNKWRSTRVKTNEMPFLNFLLVLFLTLSFISFDFWVWLSKNNKNSSGDEIVNVNYTQCSRKLSEFAEITQNNGHYAVQGHSRSPILVPIESSYTISY